MKSAILATLAACLILAAPSIASADHLIPSPGVSVVSTTPSPAKVTKTKHLVARTAGGELGPCYWPLDPGWHWSPGYMVWFWAFANDYIYPWGWQRGFYVAPYGSSSLQTWYVICPWP